MLGTSQGNVSDHAKRHGLRSRYADRIEVLPDRILLYAEDGEKVLEKLIAANLHPVTSLVRRSSLEDVFLRLTGRSLVE